jgi:hypothetical protein
MHANCRPDRAVPTRLGDCRRARLSAAAGGVLLLIVGTINFIEGIAAIGNAHLFAANTQMRERGRRPRSTALARVPSG